MHDGAIQAKDVAKLSRRGVHDVAQVQKVLLS